MQKFKPGKRVVMPPWVLTLIIAILEAKTENPIEARPWKYAFIRDLVTAPVFSLWPVIVHGLAQPKFNGGD